MGFISFIVVLCFNIYWLISRGKKGFFNLYNGGIGVGFSLFFWVYAAWGIANLIYVIYKLFGISIF